VDVIEIDAASNRGINEMRELRENVRYQPARDRYKVFIIDEAHQITNEAFNALLKTIEEPPGVGGLRALHHRGAQDSRHHRFALPAFQFSLGGFRRPDQAHGLDLRAGRHRERPRSARRLAAAGEGSVRDSLSALDQAIACCGSKLDAAEVRALLGAFSLESLEQVSQALLDGDSRRMLEVVDELERNGLNLQHFARELSRYFRNLLVLRISGAAPRLVAASAQQREKLAAIAARFSEEDLTRYLQLSLDLFRDLQFSLQPRFHLEIGLLRLVQAGRLLPIEEALARVSEPALRPRLRSAPPRPPRASAGARRAAPRTVALRARSRQEGRHRGRPSRNRPAPTLSRPRRKLRRRWPPAIRASVAFLPARKRPDAPGRRGGKCQHPGERRGTRVVTAKSYALYFKDGAMEAAVREVFGKPLRMKVTVGDAAPPAAIQLAPSAGEDQATSRALAHPEVRRFQEVFGGEIRKVRNLKES
jgi:DNA polymerase III subunit gamma/tau